MKLYRPSRPLAILSAIVGVAFLISITVKFGGDDLRFLWFPAAGLALIGFNLWLAFSDSDTQDSGSIGE